MTFLCSLNWLCKTFLYSFIYLGKYIYTLFSWERTGPELVNSPPLNFIRKFNELSRLKSGHHIYYNLFALHSTPTTTTTKWNIRGCGWVAAPLCWREMSGQNSVMQNIKLLNYIRIHPSHSTVYVADMSCAVLIASFLSFFVQHRPPSTSLARFTSQAPSIARCDHCCAFASEWPRIVRRWLSY